MKISAAEHVVMSALWRRAPQGAAEVAEAVTAEGWSDRTVKTMLSRLVAKGALRAEPDGSRGGRRHLYTPLIEARAYRRDAARGLATRLFGGRAAPMVAHLADGEGLSAEDLDELEALVRDLKERQS